MKLKAIKEEIGPSTAYIYLRWSKNDYEPAFATIGVLLTVPSNQKMNAYLKEFSALCGL